LVQNRDQINAAIRDLESDQMATPAIDDWSIKDILTHLTSREELLIPDFHRLARGCAAGLASNPQEAATDKWNDLLMDVRRHFPLDEVLAEFAETRQAFPKALDEVPDDQFESGHIPGACQITALHEWVHARGIREWRKRKGI